MAWPKKLKLRKERMGLSLHWWSQRWEALLQQWGEWGGRFCQNAECSVHQGLGKQGDQEVNWGLSTLALVASGLITLWSVKSSSRTGSGPQRPAVTLSVIQPWAAWQLPPYYTVEFEESPTRFQLFTLLTASLPGASGDPCSELSGKEPYSVSVSRCHISSQWWW